MAIEVNRRYLSRAGAIGRVAGELWANHVSDFLHADRYACTRKHRQDSAAAGAGMMRPATGLPLSGGIVRVTTACAETRLD